MLKVSRADLVLSIGLDLEIGWLPPILQGARNPKVIPGTPGNLEVGPLVETLDKPVGGVSRADGDVHPQGNPHVNLDPIRMGQIGLKVAERMGELDSEHAQAYTQRAQALKARLDEKTKGWRARVEKSGVKSVVTYHSTLAYFLDRVHVKAAAFLEPKPGIPPTAKHLLEVMDVVKAQKVPLVLIENYFDASVAKGMLQEAPWLKLRSVPVLVGGDPSIKTLDDLYEGLVAALEAGAGSGTGQVDGGQHD
jgi:zinc/manganese transport system substrate-binding protein